MSDHTVWTPAQMRSLASLADTVAFDMAGAGISNGATLSLVKNLRDHADYVDARDAARDE